MKSSVKKVLGLSVLWFSVWGFLILYLEPHGIDYVHNYVITSLYFLLVIVYMTNAFKDEIGAYVDRFEPSDLLAMTLFAVFVSVVYYVTAAYAGHSPLFFLRDRIPDALKLDYRFLITKSFEIMFQQCFFMISIYYLFDNNVSRIADMLLFGVYTMLIHVPILFVPTSSGKILFAVSFFAGVIFSYCITRSRRGFVWSYMIHFAFYVLLAVSFWTLGPAHPSVFLQGA
ncbi:MAG: hypothetical protein KGH93_00600 [Patescibacteria group bacterium]|nr:hypothetical protein [Patescibacteria group bacterium]MDE1945689.1 hypothetical protein [Patescibacteria group bacterium]